MEDSKKQNLTPCTQALGNGIRMVKGRYSLVFKAPLMVLLRLNGNL